MVVGAAPETGTLTMEEVPPMRASAQSTKRLLSLWSKAAANETEQGTVSCFLMFPVGSNSITVLVPLVKMLGLVAQRFPWLSKARPQGKVPLYGSPAKKTLWFPSGSIFTMEAETGTET